MRVTSIFLLVSAFLALEIPVQIAALSSDHETRPDSGAENPASSEPVSGESALTNIKVIQSVPSQDEKAPSQLADAKPMAKESSHGSEDPRSSHKWRSILNIVTVHSKNRKAKDRNLVRVGPVEKFSGLPLIQQAPPEQPVPSVHMQKVSERGVDSKIAQRPPRVGMPNGVRAASLIERLSSGVEGFGARIVKTVLAITGFPTITPVIHSVNDTMIVAHVPAPPSLGKVPDDNIRAHVVVNRVSLKNGKLQINMKSRRLPPKADETIASVPSVSVDTVHVLQLDADGMTDAGSVRVEKLSDWKYSVYIPVEKLSLHATVRKEASPPTIAGQAPNMEEGHEEEDTYEFLRAHLSCKKEIGAAGLRTSLCTCERRHLKSEAHHTACVGRVVDRSFKAARKMGDEVLAKKIYKAALKCRPTEEGNESSIKARECLLRLLDRLVTGKVPTLNPQARSSARKLLSALSTKEAEEEEAENEIQAGPNQLNPAIRSQWTLIAARLIAVLAYCAGLTVLLFGLSDIARHYRRHQATSQRRDQLTQLPETARALYSRLFS